MEKLAILLHGYPAEKNQSIPARELLEEMGYKVLVPKYMECDEEFSISWFKEFLKKETHDQQVDLIVGVSLGGFVLPHLVYDYPNAKLIFIATAARFKPKMRLVSGTVKVVSKGRSVEMVKLAKRLPDGLLKEIYNLIHRSKTFEDKQFAAEDKKEIINAIRLIHPNKHGELARFILKSDNRELLKSIKNRALILSGDKDVLMPSDLGRELAEELEYGEFKLVSAEHYNILHKESLDIIRNFINK